MMTIITVRFTDLFICPDWVIHNKGTNVLEFSIAINILPSANGYRKRL